MQPIRTHNRRVISVVSTKHLEPLKLQVVLKVELEAVGKAKQKCLLSHTFKWQTRKTKI